MKKTTQTLPINLFSHNLLYKYLLILGKIFSEPLDGAQNRMETIEKRENLCLYYKQFYLLPNAFQKENIQRRRIFYTNEI